LHPVSPCGNVRRRRLFRPTFPGCRRRSLLLRFWVTPAASSYLPRLPLPASRLLRGPPPFSGRRGCLCIPPRPPPPAPPSFFQEAATSSLSSMCKYIPHHNFRLRVVRYKLYIVLCIETMRLQLFPISLFSITSIQFLYVERKKIILL
jgi:hypothetical protein